MSDEGVPMKWLCWNVLNGGNDHLGVFPQSGLAGGCQGTGLLRRRGRWTMSRTPDRGEAGRGGGRSPRRKSKPSPLGRILKTGGIVIASVIAIAIALTGVVFVGQKVLQHSRQLAAEKRLADPATHSSSNEKTSNLSIGESTVSSHDAKKHAPMERRLTDPVIRISNPRRSTGQFQETGITVDYDAVFLGKSEYLTMVLRRSNGEELTADMGTTFSLRPKGTMTAQSGFSGFSGLPGMNTGPKYEEGVEIFLVVSGDFGIPIQIRGVGSDTCKVSNSVTFGSNASITYAIHRPTPAEQAVLNAEAAKNRELAAATRLELLKSVEMPSGYSKVAANTPLVPGTQVKVFGASGWTESAEVLLAGEQQATGMVKVHWHGKPAVFATETPRAEMIIADEVAAVLNTSPGSIRSEIARHEEVGRSPSEMMELIPDYVQIAPKVPLRPGIEVKWKQTTSWADYTIIRMEGERMVTIRPIGKEGGQEYLVNRSDLVMDFFFQAALKHDPNASRPPPRKSAAEIEQEIKQKIDRAMNEAKNSPPPQHQTPNRPRPSASSRASGLAPTSNYDGPNSVPSSGLMVSMASALKVGQIVQVQWGSTWYPADILKKNKNGTMRIRFRGWGESFDEDVPLNRIQLRPVE